MDKIGSIVTKVLIDPERVEVEASLIHGLSGRPRWNGCLPAIESSPVVCAVSCLVGLSRAVAGCLLQPSSLPNSTLTTFSLKTGRGGFGCWVWAVFPPRQLGAR
jgi:hypothetical protein